MRAFSKACLSLIRSPDFAAIDIETATTRRITNLRACGQVITMTVTVLSRTKTSSLPKRIQKMKVRAPTVRAIIVRYIAALFARSWAFLTSSTTWFRYVSFPVLSTFTTKAASPLMEPPITSFPGFFVTDFDSPVSIDSLMLLVPSTTVPSTGTFSPGLTRTLSPIFSWSTPTSTISSSFFR